MLKHAFVLTLLSTSALLAQDPAGAAIDRAVESRVRTNACLSITMYYRRGGAVVPSSNHQWA